jgi:hypothetical protein
MCKGPAVITDEHGEGPDWEGLEAAEAQLTDQVPLLLDAMNRASSEANTFELRASHAQRRYKAQLGEWNEMYNDLRTKQGRDFDRVKPYYFAALELKGTSHHMQTVAREFSEASLRYERAKQELDTAEASRLKDECNRREEQYAECLFGYEAAQKALNAMRAKLGDDVISRASVDFESLQEIQMKLAIEQNRINTLVEHARAARCCYKDAMQQLEKISTAVHEVRRLHSSSKAA